MLVLGIESTCDETAAAVVENGKTLLGHTIASSADVHQKYGGVFPELACRRHIDAILPVIDATFTQARVLPQQIDRLAVACGPGLVGALLIGLQTAKGLAIAWQKPLVDINHIEAHLYAAMMKKTPPFPALGLVLSGGHTLLLKIESLSSYHLIGTTRDDALGEAFDKVAALLSLPYPGGPHVEQLALKGDPLRYPFRAGRVKKDLFAFSFSGLKTAVLYTVQKLTAKGPLQEKERCDIAASFQYAAVRDLLEKVTRAIALFPCHSLIFGGGVCNNQFLRTAFAARFPNVSHFWPSHGLSMDNAAMIAGLAYHKNPCEDFLHIEAMPRMTFWNSTEK